MFKWKKLGRIFNPFDVKDRFWLKEFAQAPSVVIFEKFVRVYFSCRPHADDRGQYISYSGFVDLNRSNLFDILKISDNPILELGRPGTFDEFGTYPVSVIQNNNEYYAYYGGWTRCESVPFTVSIGLAISRDQGVSFQKPGEGPLLTCNITDPFVVSGPKVRRFNNQWYLWYVAGTKWIDNEGKPEAVYKIRMAQSPDGLNWSRDGKDLIENRLEKDECQASPDVFYFENNYHMFFCYKYSLDFRNNSRGYRIGYASSPDLKNWTRNDAKAGIDLSSEGWDSQSISYPHVFQLDGNIYMLYLGNDFGRSGFGISRLESFSG
jgi:predicted GH43/DUF377 family glycosyl hydrolase